MKVQITKEKETSWNAVLNNIRSQKRCPIGTKFTDTLKDGRKFTVVFVHWDSEKKEAVFAFEHCPFRCDMSESSTDANYRDSKVRTKLEAFFEQLPDGLQNIIRKERIVQTIDEVQIETEDKLFIPSEYQIVGKEMYGKRENGDKEQFKYFEELLNRVRRVDNENVTCNWWLRSLVVGSSNGFCCIDTEGLINTCGAYRAYGVLPCFVIK